MFDLVLVKYVVFISDGMGELVLVHHLCWQLESTGGFQKKFRVELKAPPYQSESAPLLATLVRIRISFLSISIRYLSASKFAM